MSSADKKTVDVEADDITDELAGDVSSGSENPSTGAGTPPEDDKFMKFTKKATSGAEKAIGTGYSKIKEKLANANFEPRKTIGLIDRILDWAKKTFPPESFESLSNWFARYGHGGLVCAQVLVIIYYIILAVAIKSFTPVVIGLGYAALLAILQYTADKFLSAGDTLIKSSPSRLSSEAFLNCLAVAAEAIGIVALVKAIATWQLSPIIVGIGFWALCDAVAYIAINPSLANINVSKNTAAGEEAIGILSFIVKAVVRIVPFAFGIGAIIGSVAILVGSLAIVFKGREGIPVVNPVNFVLLCACLPFASYVVFTVYHLIIDILRAILVIPGKLDKLNKE